MDYVNYKKNELRKVKVSDINISCPDLKNTNKAQTIADWLTSWIKENKISDTLLPTKAEFAYSLGVSLGTVQNVFKILEDRGCILLKQRIGAIVKEMSGVQVIRKQTTKTDMAVEVIKDYILTSGMQLGERFVSARKLSKITEIPLNTVRLSVNKLANDGILRLTEDGLILNNIDFEVNKSMSSETLVNKVKLDLKKYISENFKIGEKLPPHLTLAEKFKVSVKTIHNAIKLLEKEEMVLSRRGTYGTIVINTSMNSAFEPKREMSIFASAQDTAFYHYEKTQNRIKKIISENYSIGSKLPSIREFSESLDLSPNTIRKALNNLAKEGILRFSRGRYGGTFVIDMPDVEEQTFRWLAVNPRYAQKAN